MSESKPRVDRWKERFARLTADALIELDAVLKAGTADLAPGLACGAGRHAIALVFEASVPE